MSMDSIKSLLHFNDNVNDETNFVVWQKGSNNVKLDATVAKFGTGSLYSYNSQLIGKNSIIWNLNSSGEYEFEFFLYLTANGGTRYLIRLYNSSTVNLTLSLTSAGKINFQCETWGYSTAVSGATALTVNEWHHIVFRISQQQAKIFLDGAEDISSDLPESTLLTNTQIYLGNFNNTSYKMYIDEFVFRHSAGTDNPVIPTEPYSYTGINIAPQTNRDFGTIKSLLHFDYPYFNEPGDGLGDEIGLEKWSKESNAALYGSEIPKAGTYAPKFGYRCLYAYGAVLGTNNTGIWNLNSNRKYEIEFFVNPEKHKSSTRNLFRLLPNASDTTNTAVDLSITDDGCLMFSAPDWNITEPLTGTTILAVSEWQHVLIRVAKQKLKVFLNGAEELSANLPDNVTLNVEQVRIGYFSNKSYKVYIDEFVFRHSAGEKTPKVPTAPYNGYLDTEKIGGYGNGDEGDVIISSDTQINSYGLINSITDSRTFTVSSWSNGSTAPAVDSELMIHVTAPINTANLDYKLAGLYAFAKIAGIDGTQVVLDRDISVKNGDKFTLLDDFCGAYYIQAITVPNYNTLTINSGCTVKPLAWNNTKGGGIVAFRCTGDCIVNGSIITFDNGTTRYDLHQMTHSRLIDRFLCSKGGGIFITCGGKFTATNTARLGATWSGLGDGQNGASGYGGKGSNAKYGSKDASGGAGGVGGGGGGGSVESINVAVGGTCGRNGGSNADSNGYCRCGGGGGGGCGGNGGAGKNSSSENVSGSSNGGGGGKQGSGINGSNGGTAYYISGTGASYDYSVAGGGGGGAPGGNGGQGHNYTNAATSNGKAGACIILICNSMSVALEAISTGGSGLGTFTANQSYGCGGGGGGGTGFCYIATREIIDE